jgi:hypothetical protein
MVPALLAVIQIGWFVYFPMKWGRAAEAALLLAWRMRR